MNRLTGTIAAIACDDHIALVDVAVGDDIFSATLLETPQTAPCLQLGRAVTLLFKETELSLARNLSGLLSLRNRFAVSVRAIERGAILSAVTLDYHGVELVSIITTRSVDRLQLAVGDAVEALIKANEIALKDGHDDA